MKLIQSSHIPSFISAITDQCLGYEDAGWQLTPEQKQQEPECYENKAGVQL